MIAIHTIIPSYSIDNEKCSHELAHDFLTLTELIKKHFNIDLTDNSKMT